MYALIRSYDYRLIFQHGIKKGFVHEKYLRDEGEAMEENGNEKNKRELEFRPKVLVASSPEQRGEDLIDEAHMEGLVMQKCSGHNINHSNAFMVATMKDSEIVTEKYYKIQDKVFFEAFATICRQEEFCDEEGCRKNDAVAAEFVLEHPIRAVDVYKGIEQIFPVCGEGETRQGICYICPNTKLDEVAFPVKLYDRQMGALIVGQFTTPEHQESVVTCIREKLSGCKEEKEEKEIEDTISKIKVVENVQPLVNQIFDTVRDIEKGLIESYKERQTQYVFEKSSEMIENLKRKVKNEEEVSHFAETVYPASQHMEYYNAVGECIREQLGLFCDMVGAVSREIFTPSFENLVNNKYDGIKGNDGLEFFFAKWKEKNEHHKVCGNVGEYIEGIGEGYDLLLVADSPTYPIALAVCSNEFLEGMVEEERDLLQETFNEVFKKFAEYAQMAGLEAKSDYYRAYLDSYMSIQRHELGQSNAGYQILIEEFQKQRDEFVNLIYKTGLRSEARALVNNYIRHSDSFIRDSDAYLNTTMIRIRSTKYLIDFSEMDKTYFYPYETFLFKWNHIYELKAEAEDLQFHFPEIKNGDPRRPLMYGNPWMIEQAAYNLTNNAIKYAIRGTKVFLDCVKKENRYEITVENLGVPFDSEKDVKDIFNFGKQGTNNKKEGSGLGLFLTKKIAEAHGGDVYCKMEKLSEYNLSLIRLYIKFFETHRSRNLCNNENLYRNLKKEYDEKKDIISQYTADCISVTEFTPMYVNQNILKGTARFTFKFWIPYVL